jgi:hypothetical protein
MNLNGPLEVYCQSHSRFPYPSFLLQILHSASHNNIRLSVQDYSSFEDTQAVNQLQNIGNHRIGSIGISCPGFDLKSYIRNATLSGSPAHQISFDYSYLDHNKKALEIWTVKDNKVYIIDYVANGQVYDMNLPVVQKMIKSFET